MAFILWMPHNPPLALISGSGRHRSAAGTRPAEGISSRGASHLSDNHVFLPRIKPHTTSEQHTGWWRLPPSAHRGGSSSRLGRVFPGMQVAAGKPLLSLPIHSAGGRDLRSQVRVKTLMSLMRPVGALSYPGASGREAPSPGPRQDLPAQGPRTCALA